MLYLRFLLATHHSHTHVWTLIRTYTLSFALAEQVPNALQQNGLATNNNSPQTLALFHLAQRS